MPNPSPELNLSHSDPNQELSLTLKPTNLIPILALNLNANVLKLNCLHQPEGKWRLAL